MTLTHKTDPSRERTNCVLMGKGQKGKGIQQQQKTKQQPQQQQ